MNDKPSITVLLLGSGGREHALAWKLAQSPLVAHLHCAPGNPGIAQHAQLHPCDIENPDSVVLLASELKPDLVVVGPENPLAAGVSDALRMAGFTVFGPSKAAARLEWDKAYSKDFMARWNIPTSASRTFDNTQAEAAVEYVSSHPLPVVLKASGLAAGKGVVIAQTNQEAADTIRQMLSGQSFGSAGQVVVVEEFLQGQEASVFAVTDGRNFVTLAPSQDHKRVGDADTGPNTGGMGAYAPAPIVTPDVMNIVHTDIIQPVLDGMRSEGHPYSGCLFAGLMIDQGRPRVVEFNSRFGDPETQVVLPLLQADLAELFLAAAKGDMHGAQIPPPAGSAVCVVLASGGYPESYPKGLPITGVEQAGQQTEGVVVFHAGTQLKDGVLVTAGGRVLGVTAISTDPDLQAAIGKAYSAVQHISFQGMHFRKDIGHRARTIKQ